MSSSFSSRWRGQSSLLSGMCPSMAFVLELDSLPIYDAATVASHCLRLIFSNPVMRVWLLSPGGGGSNSGRAAGSTSLY
ncbi:hypothetical protein FB45DRAFT_1065372 [Roridomyces roridus]|uniref:Uncharacterized protein n=1 Tax=Roridomyces roridus TaxID=1738132 RepID=A0AAD7B7S6_9AGAR|nr:hypothetical protein FB45DRAFT_1065372 [Roridomyces roridus]